MGSSEQVVGLDFRITLLRSYSDMGQTGPRTENEDKPEQPTDEEGVGL